MELNYKVSIKQKENLNVKKNLENISNKMSLKIFKYDGTIELVSNSKNISEYFKTTNTLVDSVNKKDGFILGYEKDSGKDIVSFPEITESFLSDFLTGPYYKNLIRVSDFRFYKNISPSSENYLLELKDNVFTLVPDSSYTIDFKDSKIVSNVLEDSLYFILSFRYEYELEKTTSKISLTPEDFIDLTSGFYHIFPKDSIKTTTLNINFIKDNLYVDSGDIFKITSDLNINFDNCTTNTFTLIPNNPLVISYKLNDYTSLNDVVEFNSEKEYFIYELQNNVLNLKYYLASTVETEGDLVEDFNLLLQSHEEFKKPYVILSNRADIDLLNKRTNQIFTRTIENKEFSILKEDSALINTLTKIKI